MELTLHDMPLSLSLESWNLGPGPDLLLGGRILDRSKENRRLLTGLSTTCMADFLVTFIGRPMAESRRAALREKRTMPRENNLEGAQDQGGKHGGQAGMPKPEKSSPGEVVGDPHSRHGIIRDKRGEEQPADRDRARE